MRTYAEWNEPIHGSMEMDLVAHCGAVNRGCYINSLVLTDIASGWTKAAPLVVRESHLVVETLERIRVGLPFALLALDVDNGREFVNERLIEYCLSLGIELTRSHPYRKNDQAWIEQKNGPDQTAVELLIEFRARYPEYCSFRQLCTLERRVRAWRRRAVQRLMCETTNLTQNCTAIACQLLLQLQSTQASAALGVRLTFFCRLQSDRTEMGKGVPVT